MSMHRKTGIAIEVRAGRRILVAAGEVDLAVADRLAEACAAEHEPIVDLSAVTFIDSSGLGALLRVGMGVGVTLVAPSAPVLRLLEITKVANRFRIVDSVEQITDG